MSIRAFVEFSDWPTNSLLKKDVEYVFNVLFPEEFGHAGSVPHVFQQTAREIKSCLKV